MISKATEFAVEQRGFPWPSSTIAFCSGMATCSKWTLSKGLQLEGLAKMPVQQMLFVSKDTMRSALWDSEAPKVTPTNIMARQVKNC